MIVRLYYSLRLFAARWRFWIAGLVVLVVIVAADLAAYHIVPLLFVDSSVPDVSFAPEVWLSITALVLGTLVVIITIASQVVPRIIDVYMNDWRSLFYGWGMILSAVHAVLLSKAASTRSSSALLNLEVFMPLAIVVTFPYLFYILAYTKPNNIIRKIYRDCMSLVNELTTPRMRQWIRQDAENIIYCQKMLFKYINQLDNIFHYVSFKELQAQIIINLSTILRTYVKHKEHIINPNFFLLTRSVVGDISFQTLEIQFREIEESRTFLEQKCFRILGDAYNKFLNANLFDLASLCGAEMNLIGEAVIQTEDDYLMEAILIRFNTMMRSAFKHGITNQEARNLYNLAFHYSTYIKLLALHNKTPLVKQAMKYLRLYGSEVFRNSQSQQTLYFINDVFTFEMKEVLVLISELQWDIAQQKEMLFELLEMDNPLTATTASANEKDDFTFHAGVRTLQAGLALYYLKAEQYELAQLVVEDIAKDLRKLPALRAVALINTVVQRLETAVPTFWEDTDRGNNNIYYSEHKEFIPQFQLLLMDSIQPPEDLPQKLPGPFPQKPA
jgi:hypothetical protein